MGGIPDAALSNRESFDVISQASPQDKGTGWETDGSDRYTIKWNGQKYEVFEAWTGGDRLHDLPAGARVIAYNTDPKFCYALVDTDGDGKPNMLTWNPSPEQFKAWAEQGKVVDNATFQDANPNGVNNSYGHGDEAAPVITGSREGGTFDKKVTYDHAAMQSFVTEVENAVTTFESASGGVAGLAAIKVEPGQTPFGQKLRELFNMPSGRATDWFDQHVYDLPKDLRAMTAAVTAASTKVKDSDTQMEISAKALSDAMDLGAGVGSTQDVNYAEI